VDLLDTGIVNADIVNPCFASGFPSSVMLQLP
jgi:hypothetical protein